MNRLPASPSRASGHRSSRAFAAAASALAAALLALGAPDLAAAPIAWQANPADQGVSVSINSDGGSWQVSPSLVEGDVVFVGPTGAAGLGTNYSYYYVVGVGSTPSGVVRFSQGVGAQTFAPGGGTLSVAKAPTWHTVGNWAGGVAPDGSGAEASIAADAGVSTIALEHDVSLGSLSVDTTNGADTGLSLISTSRIGGRMSALTFAATSGAPTITLSGGKSLSLSEAKLSGNIPGNANSKLVVQGSQGLVIDNQNPVGTPVAVNSSTATPAVPLYAAGAFRFGYGLDWSGFTGDLVLERGVFQPLAGGSLNNHFSSLPLASEVVLGTGTNTARLEILGNGSSGPSTLRGLSSTSPNSSVINTTGGGQLSFQLGSYGRADDVFDYAGNIGDSTHLATLSSVSGIRLVKIGAGTQILSGPNNFEAVGTNQVMLAVNGGKLSLGSTGAIGAVTGGQGVANANSCVVFHNGEFALSGVGVGSPRSQTFGGALLFGAVTSATATNADDKQASQSSSFSTLTVEADPAQPASLTFGQLRPRRVSGSPTGVLNGVTTLYRGTNLGFAPGAGVSTIQFTTGPVVNAGALYALDGSGASGTAQAAVIRGALADTSASGAGSGFATYDAATGVRPLAVSEQTSAGSGAAYDAAGTNDNILLTLAADATINGHLSNTLQIRNTSGASRTVTNTGTTLNAAHGLLFSGSDPIVLTGGQITGTADSDSEDVIVHSTNTSAAGVTIQTAITNIGLDGGSPASHRQGWITFSGAGDLRLEGALTVGFTGGLAFNGTGVTTLAAPVTDASSFNFNQGVVKLDAGASWNGVPRLILASAGKLDLNGIGGSASANRFSDINVPVNPAGIVVNAAGGEVTNSSATTVDLYLSGAANGAGNQATATAFFGTITGNLNLVVDKSTFNNTTLVYAYGTQALTNANTYTGATHIRSGILNLSRGGSLPATTVVTLGVTDGNANSTLQLGDLNGSTNGAARQEIAGLYAAPVGTGTGLASVQNVGPNASQLTINTAVGVDNVYTGNLGLDPATVANGDRGATANLFGLRKIGPGSFEPAGVLNNYAGGTIVQGGILRVSSDAKLGQVGLLIGTASSGGAPAAPISAFANSIILDGGTLQATTTTDFVLNPLRGIGLGPTSGSTGGTGGLHVDSGVTLTYAGVIASAGNTGSQTLVKNGSGLLLLQGANTFTGDTQVVAGALGGTGSLASGVTVESGGAIAPGVGGVGTFSVAGPLSLKAGSALNVDLGAPGTSDLIQLSGGAVGVTGTTTVNITAGAGFGVGAYTLISGGAPFAATNFVLGSVPSGYTGTFSSTDGALTLTIAEGSALTGLETWRQSYFGSSVNTGNAADTFDADGDGLPNLLEYACGTNPTTANVSPVTVAKSGNFLTLTYTRIADTTLTYTVEGSSDLSSPANWTTVTTANNPSAGAMNTAGPVTVTDTVALNGRRFLRLKVSY